MSGQHIKIKLKNGEYKLTDKVNGKSTVWQKFKLILNENDEIIKGVVGCQYCLQVMSYHSHKTGTSSLIKHICSTINVPACSTRPVKSYCEKLKIPSSEDKFKYMNMIVKYVCKDLRPLQFISSGFIELAQNFIDTGAQFGRVDANELLPDPSTLERAVKRIAAEEKTKLISEIKPRLLEAGGAITLDTSKNYLRLTLYYIDQTWLLKDKVLSTIQLDNSSSDKNINTTVIKILRKYDLEEFFPKLIYVTSDGVASSLQDVTYLKSTVHILNAILEHAFDVNNVEDNKVVIDLKKLIIAAKSLVTYFEQSNLQYYLPKPLNASTEISWYRLHNMLESIYSQYDAIKDVLSERSEEHRMDNLDIQLVENIVQFLQLFKEATHALEPSSKPTLHLPIVWLSRLERHLQPLVTDHAITYELKTRSLRMMRETFQPHLLNKMALFLHPKLKSLKLLQRNKEKVEVRNEIRRLMNEKEGSGRGKEDLLIECSEGNNKRKREDDLLDVQDSSDDNLEEEPDELETYIKLKLKQDDGNFELLSWWNSKSKLFPNLSQIARAILAIPASGAVNDQDLSISGYFIEECRQLNPDIVDDILFLHNNLE